jgi:hypothetical protein
MERTGTPFKERRCSDRQAKSAALINRTPAVITIQNSRREDFPGAVCAPVDVVFPLSVSLFSRCRSARISAALRGTSFSAKTLQRLRVLRDIFGKKLKCDKTPEGSVLSFIDHAHPATAELFDDAVVRDGLADELGRGTHWREC